MRCCLWCWSMRVSVCMCLRFVHIPGARERSAAGEHLDVYKPTPGTTLICICIYASDAQHPFRRGGAAGEGLRHEYMHVLCALMRQTRWGQPAHSGGVCSTRFDGWRIPWMGVCVCTHSSGRCDLAAGAGAGAVPACRSTWLEKVKRSHRIRTVAAATAATTPILCCYTGPGICVDLREQTKLRTATAATLNWGHIPRHVWGCVLRIIIYRRAE